MAYDHDLANLVQLTLTQRTHLPILSKAMFGGLAFMVNGHMCINISRDRLMCRYDPLLQKEIEQRIGYMPMIMRKRQLNGYCYVAPEGYETQSDFDFWIDLCLNFNAQLPPK